MVWYHDPMGVSPRLRTKASYLISTCRTTMTLVVMKAWSSSTSAAMAAKESASRPWEGPTSSWRGGLPASSGRRPSQAPQPAPRKAGRVPPSAQGGASAAIRAR